MSGISMYKSNNMLAIREREDKSPDIIQGADNDMSFITLSDYMENAFENVKENQGLELGNSHDEGPNNQ